MHTPEAQQLLSKLTVNYFDLVVAVWLIIGIFRGRKQGMSQELLPMIKWMSIAVLAGYFYAPLAVSVRQNTGSAFGVLGANLAAYALIAIIIMLLFAWLKKLIGEKLLGSDVFGGYEYYLGMIGGLVRFACMVVVLLALMNSRVYSKAEIDAEAKEMRKSMEDVTLPTYPTMQHAMLIESLTGQLVRNNLSMILIKSVTPDQLKKPETPAQKGNDIINDVLGAPKK